MPKLIPRPEFVVGDDVCEHVTLLANYATATRKQFVRAVDARADSAKPADGTKRLLKTGHDIALARQDTIHDKCAKNPALLRELELIFGRRK